jgi:pyridoxamine 5'-phosphate oxidase
MRLNPPPDDPLPTAIDWLAEASALGRPNPNALAVASVDSDGRPSVRMVLLKELSPAGYAVFYTNYGSRKAAALDATHRAAGVLYWHELGRQVRFEGRVVRSPAAESDAYFGSRPWRSRINAWASEQSRPLADPSELDRREQRLAESLGAEPPRPPHWGGYRVWIDALELWVEGVNRFHERVRYERRIEPHGEHEFSAGPWTWQRLQP